MRDYYFYPGDGSCVPIAKLPTKRIGELIAFGFVLCDPCDNESLETIRERLELELFIRSLGLSSAKD